MTFVQVFLPGEVLSDPVAVDYVFQQVWPTREQAVGAFPSTLATQRPARRLRREGRCQVLSRVAESHGRFTLDSELTMLATKYYAQYDGQYPPDIVKRSVRGVRPRACLCCDGPSALTIGSHYD